MRVDPLIQNRRDQLVAESKITIQSIIEFAESEVLDPLVDPDNLSRIVQYGILDAPQLRNNPFARGKIRTRIVGGTCLAVDDSGQQLTEERRIMSLANRQKAFGDHH